MIAAICVDEWGDVSMTADEQVETMTRLFSMMFHPEEVRWTRARHVNNVRSGVDLLLFDYGGMGEGNRLAENNARCLVRWLEDNPNSVCVVTSEVTYTRYLERELMEQGLAEIPNLVLWMPGKPLDLPDWFKYKTCIGVRKPR